MSGETIKLVKVEEVELRQLRNRKSRVTSNIPDLEKQIETARQKAREEFQQRLQVMQQRTQKRQQQATQLKSSLANLEQNANQRLQQQQVHLQVAVQQVQIQQQQKSPANQPKSNNNINNTEFNQGRAQYQKNITLAQQEYNRLVQQTAQQFNQMVSQERQERQQQQQVFEQQLNQVASDINQERQRRQQIAKDLLADVEIIWSEINQNYEHERLAPGRLASLYRQIELTKSNMQANLPEVAIANTQQTYLALADLRLELEQKEQEALLIYNATLEAVKTAIAEIEVHRTCQVEIGEGNEVEAFDLDVDYWSNGKLSQYEQNLRQLESQLAAGSGTFSQEQIEAIRQQITAAQPQLTEIIEQARLNVLGSQMRAEIADRVVEALTNLGYTLVNVETDALYEGNDERQAYVVKVQNFAGDEVVAVINPEKEFGTNSISINAFSESLVDETAAQQNAKAVFNVLEDAGIEGVGEMLCNKQARADYRNLEEVKQRSQPTSRQQKITPNS